MAAATVNKAPVNDHTFKNLAKAKTRFRKAPNETPDGVYAFDTGAVTVATTEIDDVDDEVFYLTFPGKCYLLDLWVDWSDVDTHATPTLEVDHIVETSGGTETILIATSTAPQSGAVDELDAGLRFTDVSNRKLGHRVVTSAATAAAGTVRYKGLVYIGDLLSIA